jgi:hypothetical protein
MPFCTLFTFISSKFRGDLIFWRDSPTLSSLGGTCLLVGCHLVPGLWRWKEASTLCSTLATRLSCVCSTGSVLVSSRAPCFEGGWGGGRAQVTTHTRRTCSATSRCYWLFRSVCVPPKDLLCSQGGLRRVPPPNARWGYPWQSDTRAAAHEM